MAGPLPCDNHPEQVAVLLMTNLQAGETLTLCWPCVQQWAAAIAGVGDVAEATADEPEAATEEVADLEPAVPAPDAEAKSRPDPATPPAPEQEPQATAAQETPAAGQ